MSLTEKVKKAKGMVIPTGLIVALVVGVYGKQIIGWPLAVDGKVSVLADDVEDLKDADEKQEKTNEAVDEKLDNIVSAQNTMNVEQAKQGVHIENMVMILKRIERNGR